MSRFHNQYHSLCKTTISIFFSHFSDTNSTFILFTVYTALKSNDSELYTLIYTDAEGNVTNIFHTLSFM